MLIFYMSGCLCKAKGLDEKSIASPEWLAACDKYENNLNIN